jgi:hypothetical protein
MFKPLINFFHPTIEAEPNSILVIFSIVVFASHLVNAPKETENYHLKKRIFW